MIPKWYPPNQTAVWGLLIQGWHSWENQQKWGIFLEQIYLFWAYVNPGIWWIALGFRGNSGKEMCFHHPEFAVKLSSYVMSKSFSVSPQRVKQIWGVPQNHPFSVWDFPSETIQLLGYLHLWTPPYLPDTPIFAGKVRQFLGQKIGRLTSWKKRGVFCVRPVTDDRQFFMAHPTE